MLAGPAAGGDYRTWLDNLGDDQLRALHASLARASDITTLVDPGTAAALNRPAVRQPDFDSPKSETWGPPPSHSLSLLEGPGDDDMPSPIRLAASSNPTWQRQEFYRSSGHAGHFQEQISPSPQHSSHARSGEVLQNAHAGRRVVQDLAECVAVQEQMRLLLDAGKRDGESAFLARSEEINTQMEAAIALQKALLSSVEALSQDMIHLRAKLDDSEALCAQAESDRDAFLSRLHVIQLAGARQVVKLLHQNAHKLQGWAFLRWYHVLCSENTRRCSFLHLKKIAMSRVANGSVGLSRVWKAWRRDCQQEHAVSRFASALGDGRRRTWTERMGFRQWMVITQEAGWRRSNIHKIILHRICKCWHAWGKYQDAQSKERKMMRNAASKMLRRSMKVILIGWAQHAEKKKLSRERLSSTIMSDSAPGTRLKRNFKMWRQIAFEKGHFRRLEERSVKPRMMKRKKECFDAVIGTLLVSRNTKKAVARLYVSVLRKCLSNWRMGCCVEATVRENIFKAGYLQRKRYSDRRILVTRCVIDGNAHLPACIIEAWAATARETDPEESTHLYAHLEADSAYGLQWWRTRFKFKLFVFRSWLKTAMPWRVFSSVRRLRKVWSEGTSPKPPIPWIPNGSSPPPSAKSARLTQEPLRTKSWSPMQGPGRPASILRRSMSGDTGASKHRSASRERRRSMLQDLQAGISRRTPSSGLERAWMSGNGK